MPPGEVLAYLAGIVDGDGYFKVSRTYRTSGTVHPYYATTVGVSQLWPGEAVRTFATVFEGVIMDPRKISLGRWMARCRSEERRVGKECRCGGARCDGKKK